MSKRKQTSPGYSIVVAADDRHQLICTTPGFKYKPDPMQYLYGKSKRRPLEDWFLEELDFFRHRYPLHEIFTLGSSCVFGEKFINYLTICEFEIDGENSFIQLKKALRDSDQAIRRKFHPLWKWDIAARSGWHIVFMVGHMDLAYFLQHRKEFQGAAHNRYMSSFTTEKTVIESHDYKVLQDGTIVPFDPKLLTPADKFVFENYNEIKFETRRVV
jgi:hypothetical protein